VKINNLDTYCEQVGRRGKDWETKLFAAAYIKWVFVYDAE
jgi:hypothetical protein